MAQSIADAMQCLCTPMQNSNSELSDEEMVDLGTQGENAPARNCYRLVILGSAKVGKTSIVSRFLSDKYDDKYTPTIEDFHRKIYRIKGEAYRLDILDTSGNHPFPAMRRLSLLTGDIFILIYSIDCMDTFDEVKRLREQILEAKTQCPTNIQKRFRNPPMIVVGNKLDREQHREVSTEDVKSYVQGLPACAFLETSAKKDWNIEEIFVKLFILANLPTEMSPSLHRKVLPTYVGSSKSKSYFGRCGPGPLRRRLSDACGTVTSVRRPSIRTDLLILQSTNTPKEKERSRHPALDPPKRSGNKCVIQ